MFTLTETLAICLALPLFAVVVVVAIVAIDALKDLRG